MRLSYGINAIAGPYLINSIPLLRHVPAWVPSAGWRKRLEAVGELSREVSRIPFKQAKEQVDLGKVDEDISLVRRLVDDLPPETQTHPSYEERATIARNVAAIGYIGMELPMSYLNTQTDS
ncbi:hypothetical protein FA15DRAFT_743429 [Coprinopsis marcescibilis]|uniref:Uncharacterized protein n=1 Tax=Coprinopsis marcescibilis TaxID=230819 RepID=A0A5C3K8V6_COPMA|nr:hypothetical protein FA15DRAFT_743429 [Coprinopsis marcescibilis]